MKYNYQWGSPKYNFFSVLAIMVMMIGTTANTFVMTENECKMPVKLNYWGELDEEHSAYYDNTQVKHHYLSDIFDVGNYIVSIGDILLIGGLGSFIIISAFNVKYIYDRKKEINSKTNKKKRKVN